MVYTRSVSIVFIAPLFLLLWLLYGGNYWNGDRDAYELYYERARLISWKVEVGYEYLNIVSNSLRLNYQTFQVLVSLATIALYVRYLLKTSYAPFLAFLLYAITFFPLDYVLMRQSLAFAVSLQGFLILFENNKYNRIKFFLLVVMAASIHQSALFFLIFGFMPLHRVVSLGKSFALFCIVAVFYLIVRVQVPPPASIQAHFDVYDVSLKSAFSNLVFHWVSVGLIFLSVIAEKRSILNCVARSVREKELAFILNLNILSCFWMILYFESEIFVRLLRCLVFFNVFFAVSSLALKLKSNYINLILVTVFSLYLVVYFIVPVQDLTVAPLFNKNLFFEVLG